MFIKKHVIVFVLTALLVLMTGAPVSVLAGEIRVDGFSEDWEDKPGTYVYNWDNSQNCWVHGVWINGKPYYTAEGEYSTDVRHYLQAYKGESGIAVRVVFSRDYGTGVNGDGFNFYFGNENTKFRLTDKSGASITGRVNEMGPGIHHIEVRHENGNLSGKKVEGSAATLYIPKDKVNAELEFFIPYEGFKTQNGRISADDTASVTLMNQNIMYERVYIEGASTGALLSAMAGVGLAGVFFVKKSNLIDRLKSRKTKV